MAYLLPIIVAAALAILGTVIVHVSAALLEHYERKRRNSGEAPNQGMPDTF